MTTFWIVILGIVMLSLGVLLGYRVGRKVGEEMAISRRRARIERVRRRTQRLEDSMGESSLPRVRSAVLAPTASIRSQAQVDEDSR